MATDTRELIGGFLDSRKARNLSPQSIGWYQRLLKVFSRAHPFLPEDPETIEGFLGALNASDETKHNYFRALRAFYRWRSRRHGWRSRRHRLPNPMEDVGAPKRRKKQPYSLTMAELGWLLAVPQTPRNRALIWLLVDTGVRVSEAVNLVREDIQEETIIVSGKTGEREVPISPETGDMLLDLVPGGCLFVGSRGKLTRAGAYRVVRLAFSKAGIPARKRGPHTLRHTFGRQYIMAGGDLVSLQRILGHADIKTTRIYVELDMRDITLQHHRFTPLKLALKASEAGL